MWTKSVAVVSLTTMLLLALASAALADEEARYNFATAQGGQQLKVNPGGLAGGVIYFYNVDGNRITHVSLEASKAPDGWQISIEPALQETQVKVGDRTVTVSENLYVEPSQLLSQEPRDVPEGMVSLPLANRGYALAKRADVTVRVPESAEIGAKAEITIAAVAEWLGQGGAAAIKQSRDFTFSVQVVPEETGFTETILGKRSNNIVDRWLPAILAVVVVMLGAILIPRLVAKRG